MNQHGAGQMNGEFGMEPQRETSFGADQATKATTGETKHFKVPSVAATVVGGALGIPFGPIGIAAGLAAGGGVDFWRHKKGHKVTLSVQPPVPPGRLVLNIHALAKNNKGQPVIIASPAIAQAHASPVPSTAAIATAMTAAAANPIPEAVTLQNYFHQYPYDRVLGDSFWKSLHMQTIVTAFQNGFNNDVNAVKALGVLPVTGDFGPKTAAGYSFYTHETIDPDPNVVGNS